MSGKRDTSWVADILVTQLKSDLTAKLTGMVISYGDSVDLEAIPTDNYFVSERRKVPGYPFVAVIPEDADFRPDTGEARYNFGYHTLTVAIARTANADEDVLKRQVSRTVRAVEEVILEHVTLSGSVDECRLLNHQFGPMMAGPNSMLQEAQVMVRVLTSET